jgi:hypothetical protein
MSDGLTLRIDAGPSNLWAIAFGTGAFTLAGRACSSSRRFAFQSPIASRLAER